AAPESTARRRSHGFQFPGARCLRGGGAIIGRDRAEVL
ncbi:MAG: hypothetical protein AVDCRST_MAG42-1653, partial [uncultured Chthoniobacterales bacterium]